MHRIALLALALPAVAAADTLDVLKLKETPTGDYAVVARTSSPDAVDHTVTVTVTDLETGATLSATAPPRYRYLGLGENTLGMGPTFSFQPGATSYALGGSVQGEDGGVEGFEIDVPGCAATARCGWGETTLADGSTLRVRRLHRPAGQDEDDAAPLLTAQIRPVGLTDALAIPASVTLFDRNDDPTAPGAAPAATWDLAPGVRNLDLIRARHRVVLDADQLGGSAFNVAAQLTGPDGAVLDSWVDFVDLGVTEDLRLYEARIKPRRKGGSKLVLWTEALDDAAPANGEVVIAAGGDPTAQFITGYPDSPSRSLRTYRLGAIYNATPAVAINTYDVTITATLPDRSVAFGAQVTFDGSQVLVADGVEAPGEERLAIRKIGTYPQPDGDAELAFSFEGRDVELIEGVQVQFNEPFEADPPAETTAAELLSTVQRWVLPFDGYGGGDPNAGDDGLYDVSVTFRDDAGEVIDATSFDIQAAFGSGTRGASSTASSRTELL